MRGPLAGHAPRRESRRWRAGEYCGAFIQLRLGSVLLRIWRFRASRSNTVPHARFRARTCPINGKAGTRGGCDRPRRMGNLASRTLAESKGCTLTLCPASVRLSRIRWTCERPWRNGGIMAAAMRRIGSGRSPGVRVSFRACRFGTAAPDVCCELPETPRKRASWLRSFVRSVWILVLNTSWSLGRVHRVSLGQTRRSQNFLVCGSGSMAVVGATAAAMGDFSANCVHAVAQIDCEHEFVIFLERRAARDFAPMPRFEVREVALSRRISEAATSDGNRTPADLYAWVAPYRRSSWMFSSFRRYTRISLCGAAYPRLWAFTTP